MSTILDALKKVEGQGGPTPRPAEPNELDRQIVHGGSSSIAKPVRRGAVVLLAVVAAVIAGAGLTWLGITVMQDEPAAAVASAGPSDDEVDHGLVGVEVSGEVEEVVDGARLNRAARAPATGIEDEPDTALMARPPDPGAERSRIVVATPSMDRETVTIPPPRGAENQLDPARKLAARRTARVSGVLPEQEQRVAAATAAKAELAEAFEPTKEEESAPVEPVEPVEEEPAAPVDVARVANVEPAPAKRSVDRSAPAPSSRASQTTAASEDAANAAAAAAIANAIERPPVEIIDIARKQPTAAPEPPPRESPPDRPPTVVRANTSKVGVTATTWHPQKSRRSAQLSVLEDGEAKLITVRQGQEAGVYKVAEITPTGVTLLHEGVELQRRVGAEPR